MRSKASWAIDSEPIRAHGIIIVNNPYKYYSRLSLNEHLYKTDTLTNGHLELVPAFLYSLYLTQDRHLFKMDT